MAADASPQADALLGALRRQAPGRLTVYLGAAPGVGKTYAMLVRARELQRQGSDVVVGIVETHGRSETEALLQGLPVLPRARLPYQGRMLEELDLDALLARRPAVALVDELAHRNAPGSRHERRWQDVQELLDAGIDVHTTVNIQHLESLNDEVLRITSVRVRETVPDALFARLRDIRLVDLPAAELIERLNQGKVYLPEQATQALQAFFSPSNLTALRELAMQTVAAQVDADLREARAARGLPALALRRHVLIAIDGRGQSEYLVRAGARIAERRGAPWTVVSVERGSEGAGPEAQARQIELDRAFALARSLGGEAALLHDGDVAAAILDAAAARQASAIVVGRPRERPVAQLFNRTLTQQLLQRGARYELTIVATPPARARARRLWPLTPTDVRSAEAVREARLVSVAMLLALAVGEAGRRWLDLQDLSMVFLVAVLMVAARASLGAAFAAATLGFLFYNFFFIDPLYTFYISARRDVLTLLLFFAAALIAGQLAARLRQQVLALRAANAHAGALQRLGRQLAQAADLGQVLSAGAAVLAETLGAQVWLRLGGQEGPAGAAERLDAKDRVAADWTEQHGQASGRHTDTLSQSSWWFLPVRSDQTTLGVAGLRLAAPRLGFEQRRLAESMVADIAQAALRARLVADLEAARVSGETERLRSALLSSVSHDLRSPLSSMIGSADSLLQYGAGMDDADRAGLLATIRDEGQRLDRYIQNLLDMTRLGQQGLTLARDWIGVDELVGAAARRLQRSLPALLIRSDIPPGLPPVHLHPALVEQALFNVLENAAQFSPPGAPVQVAVRRDDQGRLRIDVSDQGPGIPETERARIFDMFFSVERGDRGRTGTGLGLTIVQAIVGAHMGSVEALPGPGGRGTTIRLTLPWAPPPGTGDGAASTAVAPAAEAGS